MRTATPHQNRPKEQQSSGSLWARTQRPTFLLPRRKVTATVIAEMTPHGLLERTGQGQGSRSLTGGPGRGKIHRSVVRCVGRPLDLTNVTSSTLSQLVDPWT
ncbi:hypothetical protein ACOMHN_000332 [Nucella lapillus]